VCPAAVVIASMGVPLDALELEVWGIIHVGGPTTIRRGSHQRRRWATVITNLSARSPRILNELSWPSFSLDCSYSVYPFV
jgi:hypothetical protein